MFILNKGPLDYRGTTEAQLPGTQGSQVIVIPAGKVEEVPDEMGERLLQDFKGSSMFEFSKVKPPKEGGEQKAVHGKDAGAEEGEK